MIQIITSKETVLFATIAKLEATNKELLEALNAMLTEFSEGMPGMVHAEFAAISEARAAIASATQGELK